MFWSFFRNCIAKTFQKTIMSPMQENSNETEAGGGQNSADVLQILNNIVEAIFPKWIKNCSKFCTVCFLGDRFESMFLD